MQWWCAARSAAWTWTWQAYPGVWLFVLAAAIAYWLASRSWREARQPDPSALRGRTGWFAAGLLCLWISLDWPVGALGAGYLASLHMLQFLLIAVVAPPLLMLGVPAGHPNLGAGPERGLRFATHPLMALIFFNVVIVVTHLPSIVDSLMSTQIGSFAIDMAWLAGGIVFWWPVVLDRPDRPAFGYPLKIGYLILATIVNAGTFLHLTFSELPVYATYELAPPVYGISPLDDQRVAGLLMKAGTASVLWAAIGILFYLWHRVEAEQR